MDNVGLRSDVGKPFQTVRWFVLSHYKVCRHLFPKRTVCFTREEQLVKCGPPAWMSQHMKTRPTVHFNVSTE